MAHVAAAALASLRVALAGALEGACCAWWAESVEWPVGASQCPAGPPRLGANATYCCGLCSARPRPEEPCPGGDSLPLASGSGSEFWGSALSLVVPAVFLLLFCCAWLWLKDDHEAPINPPASAGGTSSFVHSQLRSRYGSFSMPASTKFAMTTQEPRDLASLSGGTRVQFYQPTGEDDVILSPQVILGVPEEEAAAAGGPPRGD